MHSIAHRGGAVPVFVIEFVVIGTPRSQQARSKSQWQSTVRQAAPTQAALLAGPVLLRIDFFFEGTTDLDADNIIKPIQDALQHVIYGDDEAVVDVCSRKLDRLNPPPFISAPATLDNALDATTGDFVYIRVAAARSEVTFS